MRRSSRRRSRWRPAPRRTTGRTSRRPPPKRTLDWTAPGRSTSSSGSRGRSGTARHGSLRAVGAPARECLLDLVEHARRRDVADDQEQAAVGEHAAPVRRLQGPRRQAETPRVSGSGGRRRGRRNAVQPRLVGGHAGLRERSAGRCRAAGRPRARRHDWGTLGRSARRTTTRAGRRIRTRASPAMPIPSAPSSTRRLPPIACSASASSFCDRPPAPSIMLRLSRRGGPGRRPGGSRRHAQPHMDQRHGRAAYGDDTQTVGQHPLGDGGAAAAGAAWSGRGPAGRRRSRRLAAGLMPAPGDEVEAATDVG